MSIRCLVFLLGGISMTACAAAPKGNDQECMRYRFESGVSAYIRSSFVGTLSARLEADAPKVIMSMDIALPYSDVSKLAPGYTSAKLSTFFRPLQSSEVECDAADDAQVVRCYKQIVMTGSQLMQVLVTFNQTTTEFVDPMKLTDEVVTYMKKNALMCDGKTDGSKKEKGDERKKEGKRGRSKKGTEVIKRKKRIKGSDSIDIADELP